MKHEQFLSASEHFNHLACTLQGEERALYNTMKNVRQESAFRNRTFIIYDIRDRELNVIDTVTVMDFCANERVGATTQLRSSRLKTELLVGYMPTRLFDYPVFMHLPLYVKLRWSTTIDNIRGGSLGFDVAIRTASRYHLRERGVTYCETGVTVSEEFGQFENV